MTATAEQRLEKTNARLRRLSEAMERIQAAESREEVIDSVRDAAGGLCGADGVTVVLRTGDECHYVAEDAIGPLRAAGDVEGLAVTDLAEPSHGDDAAPDGCHGR